MQKKLRGGKFFKLYKSTTSLVALGPDGTLVEVTEKIVLEEDQDIMAAGLAEEFESWFTEALDTPPMQEPLRSLLGPKGDLPFALQVFAGTVMPGNFFFLP